MKLLFQLIILENILYNYFRIYLLFDQDNHMFLVLEHLLTLYYHVHLDIVFYNIEVDGTDNIHHVEIITEDGYQLHEDTICVRSIGGNTSNLQYHGSQYVTEKYRPVDGPKAQVVGYCHPSYEKGNSIIGKINSLSSDMRDNDMKYIHSKYISLIKPIFIGNLIVT